MKINLTSVLVDDQEKALRFYTEVLGFQTKNEIPLGEHRRLTVVSPDDPDGVQLRDALRRPPPAPALIADRSQSAMPDDTRRQRWTGTWHSC